MSTEYGQDETITSYIRQLFALPFLPHKAMVDAFNCLKTEVHDGLDVKLQELFLYVENTWLKSTVWSPRNICVYQRLVRTNNDVEGYHNRLNSKCGVHPPTYRLIETLYAEANFVVVTAKLITSHGVKTHRSKKNQSRPDENLQIMG